MLKFLYNLFSFLIILFILMNLILKPSKHSLFWFFRIIFIRLGHKSLYSTFIFFLFISEFRRKFAKKSLWSFLFNDSYSLGRNIWSFLTWFLLKLDFINNFWNEVVRIWMRLWLLMLHLLLSSLLLLSIIN